MKRKLTAVLACRNNGSRLYAKPLQYLDNNKKVNVLKMIIDTLKKEKSIKEIILSISNEKDNLVYKDIAKKEKLNFVLGSDKDVLKRLILGANRSKATDVFRVTTESPFVSFYKIKKLWNLHCKNNYDLTIYDNHIDGMGFEIFKLDALKLSHKNGSLKHRSELCDLYIRENIKDFNIKLIEENKLKFKTRLTIDNPEDLIYCRSLYQKLKKFYPKFPIEKIIMYLKGDNKNYELVKKFIPKSKSISNLWSKK